MVLFSGLKIRLSCFNMAGNGDFFSERPNCKERRFFFVSNLS